MLKSYRKFQHCAKGDFFPGDDMNTKLFRAAISRFLAGLLLTGILLFVPAGTLSYWQAWLLIGVLFIPMFADGLMTLSV
jgi:hypothetical protein